MRKIPVILALALYGFLTFFTVRAVGAVGEVDLGWALATPPRVLVQWAPPVESADGGALGVLEARQTRPLEVVRLGESRIPLAVNAYTGGAADWPARAVRALTGSSAAGHATVVVLGGLLLVLTHRFLRFHGTPTAAGAAAILLATDWSFVFFKKVLGGTELLLQTAGLLVLWALWSRRWKGGQHGTVAIAIGIGLGLGAKLTFVGTLAAFGLAALLTRKDRPPVKPPAPVQVGWLVALPLLGALPLVVSAAHHAHLPEGSRVVSHDTFVLQSERLFSAAHLGREALENLFRYLGNPLGWLADAWGTVPTGSASPLRMSTYLVAAAGTWLEWRHRTASPSAALLRFLSIAVPLQITALFLQNRDLHHLAQATVPLLLWVALGADRVAAGVARPRSMLRAAALSIVIFPTVFAGIQALRSTDAVVRTASARTFTQDGQTALVELLRAAHVHRLVVNDYELYGTLEMLAPEIEVTHGWGAVSRKDRSIQGLSAVASGGHYLVVRPSAPLIYDWSASGVGTSVAALADDKGVWAELFAVP